MKKQELAREYFKTGYNCAQSVGATFQKELNLTEAEALAVTSMFGGGISGTRGICGAVSASLMVLGASAKRSLPEEKKDAYALGREFLRRFEEKFSSTNCKTLLELAKAGYGADPAPRTEQYYKERPCARFVEFAAELLEEMLPR